VTRTSTDNELRLLKTAVDDGVTEELRPLLQYVRDLETRCDLLSFQLARAQQQEAKRKRQAVDPAADEELRHLHDDVGYPPYSYAYLAKRPGCDLSREGVRAAIRRARRRRRAA
jgi:hypothetical protein